MTAIPVDRVHYPDQHSFKVMDSKFVTDTHFTFVKTLGSGAYGVVIAANDSRDRKKVAIKKISRAFENATDGLRTLREIKLLQHFNHPNIVKMKDIINPPRGVKLDDIYLVQDLMPSDLRKVIFSKQTLSEDHTRYFIYQLLLAVKHIHSAGVIHRDLKPGNLLINEDCLLKVCDFGLARGFGKISDFKEDMTGRSASRHMLYIVLIDRSCHD
jgi:serine/threonine protein kinase